MTGRRTSGDRLGAALGEQARLTRQYQRAIGTSAEMSSYWRLHAANRRVGSCQRAVASAGGARAFTFSVAGGVDAPAEARKRVAASVDGALDDAMLDTLRLLVSEVAT